MVEISESRSHHWFCGLLYLLSPLAKSSQNDATSHTVFWLPWRSSHQKCSWTATTFRRLKTFGRLIRILNGWATQSDPSQSGAVSYSHDEIPIPIRELCLIAVEKAAIDRLKAEFLCVVRARFSELEKQGDTVAIREATQQMARFQELRAPFVVQPDATIVGSWPSAVMGTVGVSGAKELGSCLPICFSLFNFSRSEWISVCYLCRETFLRAEHDVESPTRPATAGGLCFWTAGLAAHVKYN